MSPALPPHEPITAFEEIGVRAFMTTRAAGTFGIPEAGDDPEATARWHGLQGALAALGARGLASARQVHGTRVLVHGPVASWPGWLRVDGADAHVLTGGGAAAVTVADCVPVFLAHPSGVAGLVHAGWRGVADGILGKAILAMVEAGADAAGIRLHCGPAICGRCYEVGPDVYERLTGFTTRRPRQVDLRSLLAEQAKQLGVTRWSASGDCTRDDHDRFFSHRAGDAGRQVGVLIAPSHP
jgi:copper oxidase (laccase) domain-containing protein